MPPPQTGAPPGRAVSLAQTEAHLPGPAPAGSEHLASVAPSPGRWRSGCAVYPPVSPSAPSSQTPLVTGPGRGRERRAWGVSWSWGHARAFPPPCPGKCAHCGRGGMTGPPQVDPGPRYRLTPPKAPEKDTRVTVTGHGHNSYLTNMLQQPCSRALHYSHFTDGETEAQRDKVTRPG